ncbi:MAG: hypothetical protein Q4G69_05575 [Planctomycetia bacterium]|nr:hypothetical protein [Planctomycetia bacterium]
MKEKMKKVMRMFSFLLVCTMSCSVLFGMREQIMGAQAAEEPIFKARHDSKKYGEFLVPQKIPGSLPSNDVCVEGNYLYATGMNHLTVYDISNPGTPEQIARIGGLGECRQVDFYKDCLYITARKDGMYIVDVLNPRSPYLRAHYDTVELATGIKCDKGIAYIAQRQFGTEFVDISDPSHPRHLGFAVSGEAQSVDAANGIIYVGDWGTRELSIFDVRNPKNPQCLSRSPLDGLGDGVFIKDEICYAATGLFVPKRPNKKPNPLDPRNQGGHGLDIYSVSDLKKPVLMSRLKFPVQTVEYTPDYWAVSVNDENVAYVADAYNGFFCIDVSDPKNPKGIAHSVLPYLPKKTITDPVGGSASVDGYFYLAGCRNSVYVVPSKYAKRMNPERKAPSLKSEPIPPDPKMSEELRKTFKIYDPEGQVLAASVHDENSVWIAAGTSGIQLLDIKADPPVPILIYPTRGFAYDVKKVGNRLYTAEGFNGVGIYLISSDKTLHYLGRYDCGKTVRQIMIPPQGSVILAKAANNQIHFIDISDPSLPRKVLMDAKIAGILYGRDLVDGLVDGKYAVCTAQGTGILWFDLSGKVPVRKHLSFQSEVSFFNGAAIMNGKLLFFRSRTFCICDPLESRGLREMKYYPVKGLSDYGKPSTDGTIVSYTDRRNGSIMEFDLKDPKNPKIMKYFDIKGHPELTVFNKGKMIIPCGYAGLYVER